jgi:TPR repeat protein
LKIVTLGLLWSVCACLSGCLAPLIEGAREGYDASKRSSLEAKAAAGDAQAQYDLGKTYCCETGPQIERSISVYDNQKATEWLCKSALQNYGPAQYKLALIYSGDEISGLRVLLRATALFGDKASALPVAWIWASKAADNGTDKAAALRDSIGQKLTTAERASATAALSKWKTVPCVWNDVIKPTTSSTADR